MSVPFSDPPLSCFSLDPVTVSAITIVNLRLSLAEFVVSDMRAFDQLRKLEMFFEEETRRGCSIIDLYELVQHAGNILPRL